MISLSTFIPATAKGRWSVAVGVTLVAHLGIGGGVAQWGYGGTGTGEEEAIQIDLPPLTEEELAAAPNVIARSNPVQVAKAAPVATPSLITPIVPEQVPERRMVTPRDTPIMPAPTAQPMPSPSAATTTATASAQAEANGAESGTAASSISGDVAPDAEQQAALEADYKSIVRKHLGTRRFTPQQARKAGISGSVKVKFFVDRSGAIRNVAVAGGSGHAVLDQEAVAHIQKFARVPGYPKDLRKAEVALTITLKYDVETK